MATGSVEGSILSAQQLDAVRQHLETTGYVVVLHWHFAGASHPTPLAFSDFEAFETYLHEHARLGDAIDVWPFPEDNGKRLAYGKIPAADGSVQVGGAF